MPMNPGRSFLTDYPQAAFYGMMPGTLGPAMRSFLGGRYGDVYSNYQGGLGQQAMSGALPDQTWEDYLKNMNWLQTYYGYSPRQRGESPSRFAPMTQFMPEVR